MRGAIFGMALAACFSTGAAGFEAKDASYFCTVEATAGLVFDKRSNKWSGRIFQAGDQFVLRMKYLQLGDFNVTITDAGSSDIAPCRSRDGGPVRLFEESFGCIKPPVLEYFMSLKTNRFVADQVGGYSSGDESSSFVTGGTCTKIE